MDGDGATHVPSDWTFGNLDNSFAFWKREMKFPPAAGENTHQRVTEKTLAGRE
jgi:hypothetical protein